MSAREQAAARWRRAVAVVDAILAAVVIATVLHAEFTTRSALLAALAALPLLAPLPRLIAGARRAYAAMTLVIIPYIVFSLMEAVANPAAHVLASACSLLSLLLFVMLIGYVRMTRR